MARSQIRIPESVVKKYLEDRIGKSIKITGYKTLGSGWHGTGYKVRYSAGGNEKELVLRTLMPDNFSHDYASDRAKVFILQHELARNIPGHVKSIDVAGYTGGGKLVSLGEVKEYFQAVEVAYGSSYSEDFQRIKTTGKISSKDIEMSEKLADLLVKLHAKKFKGSSEEIRSIRRRHSRDALGHGEMMLGVIDTFPDVYSFATPEQVTDLICKAARFRERIKDVPFIPRRMHGDFHPGNIIFDKGSIKLLDASREEFGDPADDVTTLAINYIWFAVMQSGGYGGPFRELFDAYWRRYFSRTKDNLILKTAGIYFAFRGMVVVHPVFYSAQSDATRKKMLRFVDNVLSDDEFDPGRIKDYLR